MSFDEVVLPLRVGYGTSGGPSFSTEIVTIDNGYERRNQNWTQARRVFDASTGVRSSVDAAALLAFFHARAGRARGFRLHDWSDGTSAADGVSVPTAGDQTIGAGDGATTQFQLVKIYGSGGVVHTRTISKPVAGSVVVALNGVTQTSGWSVNTTTGLITFATPPGGGVVITAGYSFDVPVRFDADQLTLTVENYSQYKADISIIEIRI
ncbi:MAG: DUF2460 domain-containing protein [Alphaproteobacteria bacterium]|nr:DUF2460 domain-containing protein [Alphaproteobacteria bacterium]